MQSVSPVLRRLLAVLVCAATLLAGLVATGASASAASARSPRAPRAFSATIEPETAYVAQDSCDPHIKRGTAKLGAFLKKTYPDISWGSTRPCDSTTSEHYDGRAIDWMASARNAHQHAEARALITWLLATDKYGNRFAMARRLGVMYLIFNSRMWGAWDGKWEEYNGCQHGKLRQHRYDNDCHRTHVHISLSWNGARAKTTFWTGHVSRTDYGPCKVKGHRFAPKWTHVNHVGCPGQYH